MVENREKMGEGAGTPSAPPATPKKAAPRKLSPRLIIGLLLLAVIVGLVVFMFKPELFKRPDCWRFSGYDGAWEKASAKCEAAWGCRAVPGKLIGMDTSDPAMRVECVAK